MELRRFVFVVAVAAGCAAVTGCSSDQTARDSARADHAGLVHLGLGVAPGIDVNQIAYQVTGNGQNVSGTIDTNDPNATPSVQVGLPAGAGYQVTMNAVSTSGIHCGGSATFNVIAGATTQTFVNVLCDATNNGSTIGGKQINGQFTQGDSTTCPDVAFYTVAPLQTSMGEPVTLNGAGTAGTVTAKWTAIPQGTFADPNAASTTFTCPEGGVYTLTFTVTDGKSCVDSQSVNISCVRSCGTCGNGVQEAAEECDDGNFVSGDGCTGCTCQHEVTCGDGVVEFPEQCDPPVPGLCSPTCQPMGGCGDGFLQPGEQCDPPVPGFCAPTCQYVAPVCGDGIVQVGEQCDPPDGTTCNAFCNSITEPSCGDGVVQPGEQCDPPAPGFCAPTCQNIAQLCGDGFVQAGEQCDPPNGTTCSPTCQIQTAPGVCGNGVVEAPETCEPPSTPTCDPLCHLLLSPSCGNGTLQPGEQCDPPNSNYCGSQCLLGGPCTACENANCGSVVTDCTQGSNASACVAALQCSRTHQCYTLDPAICYCGNVDLVSCQTGAISPNGPCIAEYVAAATSSAPSQILLDLTDPSTPLGKAGFIQQCDNAFCTSECFGPAPPPFCGNGIVQAGEQCDPPSAGFCSSTCLYVPPICGDGIHQFGEQCDPPGGSCSSTCTLPCGNGTLDPGEQCDPPQPGFCSSTCQNVAPVCGNGIVQAGEQCDPPQSGICSSTCQSIPIVCGNGIVQPGEQCDPPQPGFCSPTCQNVPPVCGNGIVQAGEQCDPPQTGVCTSTCQVVQAVCGDGFIQRFEQCDDGNLVNGDGCGSFCYIETGVPCGNGVIDAGEECDPPNTQFCDAACQLGGACTACEQANCGTVDTDCTNGPNAGQCIAALNCSRLNACYTLDPAICYCGTLDFVTCQTGGIPNGPCVAEYSAAASSSTPSQLLLDLTDPSTALGRAGFVQQCDNAFCTPVCF